MPQYGPPARVPTHWVALACCPGARAIRPIRRERTRGRRPTPRESFPCLLPPNWPTPHDAAENLTFAINTVTAVNTFGANGLVSRYSGGSSVFYTFDPQGTVCQRLDSNGNVLSSHMFDAYGAEYDQPSGTKAGPFGFGGQWGYYTDTETGLILLTNRYYDPARVRFLTRDPSGHADGVNRFSSVGNSAGAGPVRPA